MFFVTHSPTASGAVVFGLVDRHVLDLAVLGLDLELDGHLAAGARRRLEDAVVASADVVVLRLEDLLGVVAVHLRAACSEAATGERRRDGSNQEMVFITSSPRASAGGRAAWRQRASPRGSGGGLRRRRASTGRGLAGVAVLGAGGRAACRSLDGSFFSSTIFSLPVVGSISTFFWVTSCSTTRNSTRRFFSRFSSVSLSAMGFSIAPALRDHAARRRRLPS